MTFERHITVIVDEEKLCERGIDCIKEYFQDLIDNDSEDLASFEDMFFEYQDYFFDECTEEISNFNDGEGADRLYDKVIDYMKDILFDYYTELENEYMR